MLKSIKNELKDLPVWEARSYKVIVLAAVLIAVGLTLGSFIKYTVILATGGSAILLIGIGLYIYSQLIEEDKDGHRSLSESEQKTEPVQN